MIFPFTDNWYIKRLSHESYMARWKAAQALAKRGNQKAIQPLIDSIGTESEADFDYREKWRALEVLEATEEQLIEAGKRNVTRHSYELLLKLKAADAIDLIIENVSVRFFGREESVLIEELQELGANSEQLSRLQGKIKALRIQSMRSGFEMFKSVKNDADYEEFKVRLAKANISTRDKKQLFKEIFKFNISHYSHSPNWFMDAFYELMVLEGKNGDEEIRNVLESINDLTKKKIEPEGFHAITERVLREAAVYFIVFGDFEAMYVYSPAYEDGVNVDGGGQTSPFIVPEVDKIFVSSQKRKMDKE